jgi:D-arabinonate dehydratase
MSKRCTVITRVHTNEGIFGESYNGDEEGDAQVRLVRTITGTLAPLLEGHDAAMVESCWQAMLPITYDILGDRALAMKAIACVDSALWDALGKALAAPLFKIWGGFRNELPIIAIGGYYGITGEELAAEMEAIAPSGLRAASSRSAARLRKRTPGGFVSRVRLAATTSSSWRTRTRGTHSKMRSASAASSTA